MAGTRRVTHKVKKEKDIPVCKKYLLVYNFYFVESFKIRFNRISLLINSLNVEYFNHYIATFLANPIKSCFEVVGKAVIVT